MNVRAILSITGIAFLAAGALMFASMLAMPISTRKAPLAGAVSKADSIGVAFYAQNGHFREQPLMRFDPSAIDLRVRPKWVQRGFLVTDRRPEICVHDGRDLHVFTLVTATGTSYAVGFILDPRRNAITCSRLSADAASVTDRPSRFAAAEALLRRGKLEYVAHAELRDLPQARYQSNDPPMRPVQVKQ